jgi:hypothetical protein
VAAELEPRTSEEVEAGEVVLAYGGTGSEVYAPPGAEDEPAAEEVPKALKPD